MCPKERHKGGKLFAAVFTMGDVSKEAKDVNFPGEKIMK